MDQIRFLDLRYFFERIRDILTNTDGSSLLERLLETWTFAEPFLRVISLISSFIFLFLFIYAYVRYKQIKAEEEEKFTQHFDSTEDKSVGNERWQNILVLSSSDNPNDWKQAIIGADVILDELISTEGYHGDSLGEKLKSIDTSDLTTLDSAWEAHKVRNKIAHEGGDFILTDRETKRVLGHFEAVFKELGYL